MESIYKKINTEVGYIEAKKTQIYLDSFQQESNILILLGKYMQSGCEKSLQNINGISIVLTIKGVKEYSAVNIEDFL